MKRSHLRSWLWLLGIVLIIVTLFALVGRLVAGGRGAAVCGGIAIVIVLVLTLLSSVVTQGITHARRAGDELTHIQRTLALLASKAGIATPTLYIVEDDAPNAFAFQGFSRRGKVAVTTGIVKELSPAELTGVLAHEVGHLVNRDSTAMTIATSTVGTLAFLADVCQEFAFQFGLDSRRYKEDRQGNREEIPPSLLDVLGIIFGAFLMIIAYILYTFGLLMSYSMSRSREFTADLKAVELTNDPGALKRALLRLSSSKTPASSHSSTEHLWIVTPGSRRRLKRLFNTHPPIEQRIKILADLEHAGK